MRKVGLVAAALVVTLVIAGITLGTQARKQESEVQSSGAVQQTQLVTLNVPEMDCAGCEAGIKIAANKVDGVTDVRTNVEARTADVMFDPSKTDVEAIASAITRATGFVIEVPKSGRKT